MSNLKNFLSVNEQPVTGEITTIVDNGDTSGYLLCDGSTVSQSTYSNLYSKVGLIANDLANTWVQRSFVSGAYNIYCGLPTYFAYDDVNDIYLAKSSATVAFTSTDAVTWTIRSTLNPASYNNPQLYTPLLYGDGVFFIGCTNGIAIRSSDQGATWVAAINDQVNQGNGVCGTYGNSTWVYVAAGNIIRTSTNAVIWTQRSAGGVADTMQTLVYADSLFVGGTNNGKINTSTDAITWTAVTGVSTTQIRGLTYGNNLWVCGDNNGVISTSTDATTWSAISYTTRSIITSIVYAKNIYHFSVQGNSYVTSTDLVTFVERPTAFTATIYSPYLQYIQPVDYLTVGGIRSTGWDEANFYSYDSTTEFALPSSAEESIVGSGKLVYIKT